MNDKLKNIIVSILFLGLIIGIMFINIFTKDNEISISERRKLEQFPKLTLTTLLDKSFFEKFDKYTTDQFIKRDDFRLLKAKIELKTKANYNNLYLYNDYIISNTYPLNEKSIVRVTNKINYIKNNYLDETSRVYYSIIPDKNYFINKNITIHKDNLNENIFIKRIFSPVQGVLPNGFNTVEQVFKDSSYTKLYD